MAKAAIDPTKLAEAIQKQLTIYHEDVVERVDAAGEKAIKKIVKLTKDSAPEQSGQFKRSITYKKVTRDWKECSRFIWGVKAPHYRLTHLLVHGHATRNGGRVPGNPFLKNALDSVLPEYEEDVEEAVIP